MRMIGGLAYWIVGNRAARADDRNRRRRERRRRERVARVLSVAKG